MPELTTSWCSTACPVRTNALVNHGGFALGAAMNWSQSSLCIPAVHYVVSWWSTTIWVYSHPIGCCFVFLLHVVLWTICKCEYWVIFLVAVLASLWLTDWYRHCCCVPARDALDEAPIGWLDSDPLTPCWGVFVAMICWCGRGDEDDNEKKWDVLRNI